MKIGLCGFGRWGKNWARVIEESSSCELHWIADPDPAALAVAREAHPMAGLCDAQPPPGRGYDVDGVVIAAPSPEHHDLAYDALVWGRHVLIEKPVAMSVTGACELVEIAVKGRLVMMPAHTFTWATPVRHLLAASVEVGPVRHVRLQWFGSKNRDVDVLWNLGPHPLSILDAILPQRPLATMAAASSWNESGQWDVLTAALHWRHCSAELLLSRLDPTKTRSVTVIGERGCVSCEPTVGELNVWSRDGMRTELATGPEPLTAGLNLFCQLMREPRSPAAWRQAEAAIRVVQLLDDIARTARHATATRVLAMKEIGS
jgi:predicted dehydrogenase